MICQPPEDWVRRNSIEEFNDIELIESSKPDKALVKENGNDSSEDYLHWKDALKSKEFYLLWITRLSVVLITQVPPNFISSFLLSQCGI